MDHRRKRSAGDAELRSQGGKISRRTMVAGAVATTALAAVLPLPDLAYAQVADSDSNPEMMSFLLLSQALTGVSIKTLAPELSGSVPGTDPINVKDTYFDWIKKQAAETAALGKLLQIAGDSRLSSKDIIAKVNGSDDDTKYLARSIVLLWYLGSWYEPADLKKFHDSPPQLVTGPIPSKVVEAKAYTQGLVWQIAGAHPMGYSNLQFGYWSRDPHDPNGPNGKPLPLFSPSES
jgi:hypothetical protein